MPTGLFFRIDIWKDFIYTIEILLQERENL